jgi:hypothetical protein
LLSQLTGGFSAQPERTREEDDECCLGGPAFHLFLFFSLYMGKKRIHAGIAASTSESPATIAMFTHDSMPHYPNTTPRRPRSPRSERVVWLGTNSPTRTLFGGKEGNKNYKHLGTELLDNRYAALRQRFGRALPVVIGVGFRRWRRRGGGCGQDGASYCRRPRVKEEVVGGGAPALQAGDHRLRPLRRRGRRGEAALVVQHLPAAVERGELVVNGGGGIEVHRVHRPVHSPRSWSLPVCIVADAVQ